DDLYGRDPARTIVGQQSVDQHGRGTDNGRNTNRVSPAWIVRPRSQRTSTISPGSSAAMGISIFIASITINSSPALTRAPVLTAICHTFPVIGELTGMQPGGMSRTPGSSPDSPPL